MPVCTKNGLNVGYFPFSKRAPIKEMRLEGSSSIEAANAWLDIFIADFNRRFARPSKYPKDLHRPVSESHEELDDIFAWQELRKLSKSLTFRYDKMIYLVEPTEENTRIAGEKITVYDYPDGTLAFKYGYRSLKYQVFDKLECVDQGQIRRFRRRTPDPMLF